MVRERSTISCWNSHHLTEEEASDINCLRQKMHFWNPSPGNFTTVHTLAHNMSPSDLHDDRSRDWHPNWLGPGLCTLCPLPWVRRILHKMEYWGLPTRTLVLKKPLGERQMSSKNHKHSSPLQLKHQDLTFVSSSFFKTYGFTASLSCLTFNEFCLLE